jgi:hypothetical protein
MFRNAIAISIFAVPLGLAPASSQEKTAPTPTVSVVGVAEEEARPDIAVVTLNVVDDRPTANDAASENARIAAAVIDGLKGSGVDAKDISTVGLGLSPTFAEQRDPKTNAIVKSVPSGFHAMNSLRVKVRDIDRAGALIAASVQNGALYQGLGFELSDREAREDALRIQAAANAMHRAELYAKGVGMKLGAPRSLSANGGESPRFSPMASSAKATGPGWGVAPVEPGMVTIHESVNATWDLAAP